MSISTEPPDWHPERCRSCGFRLRLREGLARPPLDAECPRCHIPLLFAPCHGAAPSRFAERVTGLSDRERLRFYHELVYRLIQVLTRITDRSIDAAKKVEQVEWLGWILVILAARLKQLGLEEKGVSDLDICNHTGGNSVLLDRHSRKALVKAVADSYHSATGQQIAEASFDSFRPVSF